MWQYLNPVAWAVGAYFLTVRFIGAWGWLLIGPVLLLILFSRPDWAAALFLGVVGVAVAVLVLWAVIRILPWAIFFLIGVWMAYWLIIGLGQLAGA